MAPVCGTRCRLPKFFAEAESSGRESSAGAELDEVNLYGTDSSATAYYEGAIYRQSNTSFGTSAISPSYGGTWQNSGIAATGTNTVNLYSNSDPAHVMDSNYRYVMAIATEGSGSNLYGLRVTYTIN